ncbi:MAG: Omp28-related outer membrane protein [Bacteroidota bacterium]
MKRIVFTAALFSLFIASCDYVANPKEDYIPAPEPEDTLIRKVLLEDYTGHQCGPCPAAGAQAVSLKNTYGERLITIGVHAGFLADPLPPNYPANYHTTAGDAYFTFFGITTTPKGMVNRRNYPTNGHNLSWGAWSSAIGNVINTPPVANIEITHTYNTGTRQLNLSTSTRAISPLSGNYYVVALITEDSIISPQNDASQNPSYVPNYVHRHVLRGSVPDAAYWGYQILNGTAAAGDTLNYTFPAFTLPSAWNDAKCHIVVYVYDNNSSSATYKEIIQAEEVRLR